MRADPQPAPLLLAHSLPAFGSAGLAAMLPILGTDACALPTVLLNATANHAGVQRWPQPLVAQLEASWTLHMQRGAVPDLFIGYLADAGQALELADWLRLRKRTLGCVYADPICGDHGKAYVAPELITAWVALLSQVDVAFPNTTEYELLAQAAGVTTASALWLAAAAPRTVIVTSSVEAGLYGNRLLHAGTQRFIAAQHIRAQFSGTGDVFAACCLRARRDGLDWVQAVDLAARQTESLIRRSLASGEGQRLRITPEIHSEAVEH